MTAARGNVFLVDDDRFMLQTVKGILCAAGYVVMTFERPAVLLAHLSANDRGCVVLDLQMPGSNGLELQRALGEHGIMMPLIFISGHADLPSVVTAMKQGAVDFLSKPIHPEALLAAVESALQKDAEATAARTANGLARVRWATLSQREQAVCRLSARGLLNKQVGIELGSGESTVQAQRARALKKLQINSLTELASLVAQIDAKG